MSSDREFALIYQPWLEHARKRPQGEAIIHWSAMTEPRVWTWSALVGAADALAARLRAQGVRRGQVCAIILRHDFCLYPTYLSVALVGATPAVLAYPNARLHPEKFRQGLEGMLQKSGFDWILTEKDLGDVMAPIARYAGSLFSGILFPYDWRALGVEALSEVTRDEGAPDQPCLLQHSSGTTGLQKPVLLSHRAVLDHLSRYAEAIELTDMDRVVSWLPLYHDMGLIAAFHLPLRFGIPLIQLDPFEWVKWPSMMLGALSQTRGTVAWLPNFAYNLMGQRASDEDLQGVRLDSVRMLINCSEPVRGSSHELLLNRCKPFGLREEAFTACYAMAETTFAVTQTRPRRRARELLANRARLLAGEFVPAALETPEESTRVCVSSGAPIRDCRLRIVDSKRRQLEEGQVGEVEVKSISLFSGYRNHPDETSRALHNGWYRTGDLGFLYEQEIYVIGRVKDLIIVAGKNIYPEDIEDALSSLEGVIPGRVVALGLDKEETGTEEICVIVETPLSDEGERRGLRNAVLKSGMALDVTISQVVLVPPRWLFKSSSGKPCRRTNKERLLEYRKGRVAELAGLGAAGLR